MLNYICLLQKYPVPHSKHTKISKRSFILTINNFTAVSANKKKENVAHENLYKGTVEKKNTHTHNPKKLKYNVELSGREGCISAENDC